MRAIQRVLDRFGDVGLRGQYEKRRLEPPLPFIKEYYA
jgi:hypothetical protein